MLGQGPISSSPISSATDEEDGSVFRHRIVKTLKNHAHFVSCTEEYAVSIGQSGGVIDIVVRFDTEERVVYFVIECKDYRESVINFPKTPIADAEKSNWALYYEFVDREKTLRKSFDLIDKRPLFYATDISCSSKGKNNYDFDMFYRWSTQTSSNFMSFAVEEKKQRETRTGNVQDIHVFPILVSAASMTNLESIIVNPHPFNFEHLSYTPDEYMEPNTRGELKKHTFLFVHETQLIQSINSILAGSI